MLMSDTLWAKWHDRFSVIKLDKRIGMHYYVILIIRAVLLADTLIEVRIFKMLCTIISFKYPKGWYL
jgi:hypothetical protein